MAEFVNTIISINPWYATLAAVGAGIVASSTLLMGSIKLKKITLPVNADNQSETVVGEEIARKSRIFQNEKCMHYLYEDATTLFDVLHRGAKESNNGHCLGKLNKEGKGYDWVNYDEVLERIKHFGAGLLRLGLNPGPKSFIGIYATNCVEYVIAEYGCYHYSMITVPLYDTLGPNACSYIINQADITCVVCDTENRVQALTSQANNLKNLKFVIVTQKILESYRSKAMGFGIKVYTIDEIEELGKAHPREFVKPKPSDLAVVCYTSGTTGNPKGAMLTHENVISNLSAVMFQLGEYAPNKDDTLMSFLPLAHMFERCCEAAVFMVGARVGFFSGDVKNLCDDMKALKATIIPCVPRLLNRIHDKVFANVKGNRMKDWLLRKGLAKKQWEIDNHIIRNNGFWDKLVFKSIREGLGGKLRLVVVGSAPMAPSILTFARCAFGCIVVEGYGQTECVCPCTLTLPGDSEPGHVGPPLASSHVKLVDVPEMEYYASDMKGEICVKGPAVFQGYFKEPNKTAEVLDDDGWLHTGDIGLWLPSGTLRVIDRIKHIFKLSQGEYIAPEKIESIYSRSQFVAQIFVYGESLKSCLVGIIVPDHDIVSVWSREHNMRGTIRDLCDNPRVKQAVLDDLIQLGKKGGLRSFEQVKDICLYPEAFSIDNGLLTPTLKTRRPECRKFFVHQIEEMYRSLD